MAIAQVGNWTSAQFNGSSGGSLAGRTSTAGNHVVICYSTDDTVTHTVTHSQAGTVQTGRAAEASSTDTVATMYVENIVGGASHTITLTTSASKFSALHATEYSGVATSSSLDVTARGTGTDTTNTFDLTSSSTASLAGAGELSVGTSTISTNHNAGAGAWSGQSGYTVRGQTTDGSVGSVSCITDNVSVSGTAANVSRLTDSGGLAGGSGTWIIQTVTFKAAGGAADTPWNRYRRPVQRPITPHVMRRRK